MKLILICLLLGLAPLPASGRSPCIPELVGPRCLLLSPDGSLEYRVTIIGDPSPFCGPTPMPIPNSTVTIRFRHVGDTLTCFCSSIPGPRPHVFTASTNAFGEAVFHIAGGGCAALDDPAIPGPLKYAAEIFVDGIYLDELGIVSPDVVDNAESGWRGVLQRRCGSLKPANRTRPLNRTSREGRRGLLRGCPGGLVSGGG